MFISNKVVDLRLCRGKNSSSAIERIARKGATDEPAPAQGLQSHRQASQDSKAAREIRISQLTVSEQLRFLEEECGGKFIPGSRKGSAAGKATILEYAAADLRQLDDVQRTIGTAEGSAGLLLSAQLSRCGHRNSF